MEGDLVKVWDVIHPGSTLLYKDNTFGYAYFEYVEKKSIFLSKGKKVIDNQIRKKIFATHPGNSGYIYFSIIPWVSFTQFKHAQSKKADLSIPRVVFGKFYRRGDKVFMPVSVEVHHALVDGFHVGKYFQKLEKYTDGQH